MKTSDEYPTKVVQTRAEFTCECGSPFVKLANGSSVCAKTVARFELIHGYTPGRSPKS